MTIDREVTISSTNEAPQMQKEKSPLGREILHAARYYLGGRRGWIVLATVAVVGGIVLNWGWLVAVGVAPLLLGILPCAAMCALGLCMGGMGKRSNSSEESPAARNAEELADGTPVVQSLKVSTGSPRRRSKAPRPERGSTRVTNKHHR
jgi:hypothetical protein